MALMFRSVLQNDGGAAELIVTCDSEFAGATISCSDGTTTLNKTCPSSSPYEVTFKIPNSGDWTISATVSGTAYTSDPISVELDYTALLEYGFNWRRWVDTAQYLDSTDYSTLSDLLADEEALRELCLEHACVDYLADIATANEDVETIINNDLFAKWANNSDYSLDVLGANTAIKALMDTADKYGYGEWALIGQVPKMTSATAPYGQVGASSEYSSNFAAWKAFAQTNTGETTSWIASAYTGRIYYRFPSPVCVKKIYFENRNYGGDRNGRTKSFTVQGSDDGSTWVDLTDTIVRPDTDNVPKASCEAEFDNNTNYLYYAINVLSTMGGDAFAGLTNLQFYAWQPKGNVPVMTSATAPYGSVMGTLSSSYPAYYAFDNNPSTKAVYSASSSSAPIYIGYVFTNPICVKAISWRANIDSPQLPPTAMQLEGSNDGTTWESIGAQITNIPADTEKHIQEYNNDKYYLYLRCACTDRQYNSYWYIQFSELQFYGREMSVSVPEMTSDTTPYGECIWSTEASYAWYSFNTNDSINIWQPSDGVANNRIGYKFTHPVVAKKVHFTSYASANDQTSLNMKIQGYDGTNWVTLSTFTLERATAIKVYDIDLNNDIPYETYCLFTEDVYRSSTSPRSVKQLEGIQFYGLDYSEKEFEEGTTKKWLYDHGVELETITISRTGTKGTDAIQLTAANAQAVATIDTTDYSLMRGKVGSHASGTNQLICGSGASNFTASNMPYNNGFDVSSVNGSNAVGVKQTANGIFDVKEFWLE